MNLDGLFYFNVFNIGDVKQPEAFATGISGLDHQEQGTFVPKKPNERFNKILSDNLASEYFKKYTGRAFNSKEATSFELAAYKIFQLVLSNDREGSERLIAGAPSVARSQLRRVHDFAIDLLSKRDLDEKGAGLSVNGEESFVFAPMGRFLHLIITLGCILGAAVEGFRSKGETDSFQNPSKSFLHILKKKIYAFSYLKAASNWVLNKSATHLFEWGEDQKISAPFVKGTVEFFQKNKGRVIQYVKPCLEQLNDSLRRILRKESLQNHSSKSCLNVLWEISTTFGATIEHQRSGLIRQWILELQKPLYYFESAAEWVLQNRFKHGFGAVVHKKFPMVASKALIYLFKMRFLSGSRSKNPKVGSSAFSFKDLLRKKALCESR